jgi:hypothetical protein
MTPDESAALRRLAEKTIEKDKCFVDFANVLSLAEGVLDTLDANAELFAKYKEAKRLKEHYLEGNAEYRRIFDDIRSVLGLVGDKSPAYEVAVLRKRAEDAEAERDKLLAEKKSLLDAHSKPTGKIMNDPTYG